MNLIYRLKTGWTSLKFVRVGLGGLILYSSAESGQVTGIIVGGIFTLFSLFSDGACCAGGACYTNVNKKSTTETENIDYEELGAE